jgi:hypothetical protein
MKLLEKMPSSGMLRLAALVRTEVLEELIASTIRVTRIGELGIIPAFFGCCLLLMFLLL